MEILIVAAVFVGLVIICSIPIAISQSKRANDWDKQIKNDGFIITRSAGAFKVDDKNKKWYINDMRHKPVVYDFSEIINSKIEENSVLNKVNKLGVYIYTKTGGAVYIALITSETKRDGFVYSSFSSVANQINSMAQSIVSSAGEKSLEIPEVLSDVGTSGGMDNIEEQLKKLKAMLDSGLITEQDFEAKKKQLLGL